MRVAIRQRRDDGSDEPAQLVRAAGQVTPLATRAAAHTPLGDPGAVARLLDTLHAAGPTGQVTAARMTAVLSASWPVRYPNCAEVRALPLVGRSSTVYLPSRHLLEPKGPGTGWSAKPLAEARGRGGMMLLPDFSEWQSSGEPDWTPTPDFAGVKRRNGGAAIIRVGWGHERRDYCFTRNRRAAQRHKYAFLGLYHYTVPGDMAVQARAFCRWVGKLAPNEIPMVDIEAVSGDQNDRAETWFDIVDRKLGLSKLDIKKRSWLYSGEFILTNQLTRVCASGRNVWVAAYRPEEPRLHHILWQSTDGSHKPRKKEKWPGARVIWPGAGKCDTNVYHGMLKQLVSTVSRDDLPYPRKKLVQMVQQGVAAELRTKLDGTGTTLAQGAQAAVGTEQALPDLTRQVTDLAKYLKQLLPDPQGVDQVSRRDTGMRHPAAPG